MSDYMCPECQMAESMWPDDGIPPVVKEGKRYCLHGLRRGLRVHLLRPCADPGRDRSRRTEPAAHAVAAR